MMKIFGRQLFFKFNHLIYKHEVKNVFNNSNLCYAKIVDNLEKINMGYFSIRMLEKVLKKNKTLSECYMFTTKDKFEIVGFALVCFKGAKEIHYRIKNTDAFITALGVFPAFRGRGYSQDILNGVEKICAQKNVSIIKLAVDYDNIKAIGAYEKFGFKKCDNKRFIRLLGVDFLSNKVV